MINFEQPIVCISHTDFDGTGSPIALRHTFQERKDIKTYLEGNHSVNERIQKTIEANKGTDYLLIIADHSPSLEMYNLMVEEGIDFYVFDHHKQSQVINIEDPRLHVVIGKSGTQLFYDWLVENVTDDALKPRLASLKQFIYHVNDYDMWIHESEHSKRLNELLYATSISYFLDRFIENPDVTLTEMEDMIVDIAIKSRDRYIEKAKEVLMYHTDHEKNKYGVVFAESHQSELGNRLIAECGIDYIFMVNAQISKVSLRGNGKVDVSEIAAHFGNILETNNGGHHDAAGFGFNQEDLPKIYHLLETY